MPVIEQWSKPNREFSDKVIYEYKPEQKGRIIREAAPGKSFTDLYFEDNWEPIAYYNLAERRYVGINEYVGKSKKTEEAITEAVSKAEATPTDQKVGPEPAPPPPPPATSAPVAPVTQEESPTAPKECPCKQKLTDGEKGVLNFGLTKEMLNDPNAAAAGLARQLGGRNGGRLAGLISSAGNPLTDPTGVLTSALPSLQRMKSSLDSQAGIVDAFAKESARFTEPRYLTSIISSMSLFAELNCALGIEGIDIGVGLNVVNNNGQFSIDYAVNANVDIEKVLNKFSDGSGSDLADQVRDLQSGLDGAFAAIDEANNKLNSIMNEAAAAQAQAAAFIAKYTSINSLANLINEASTDPCFKLGSTLNGSLVSPEFLNTVSNAGFGGGGTSNR